MMVKSPYKGKSNSHKQPSSRISDGPTRSFQESDPRRSRSPESRSPSYRERSESPRSPNYRSARLSRRDSGGYRASASLSRRFSPPRRTFRPGQCKVAVNNLSANVSKEHLYDIFKNFGTVDYINIVKTPPKFLSRYQLDAQSYGPFSAYIKYTYPSEAQEAHDYMNLGMIDNLEVRTLLLGR